MSTLRFPPEFKEEASRETIEREASVTEISERLGVSAQSLLETIQL